MKPLRCSPRKESESFESSRPPKEFACHDEEVAVSSRLFASCYIWCSSPCQRLRWLRPRESSSTVVGVFELIAMKKAKRKAGTQPCRLEPKSCAYRTPGMLANTTTMRGLRGTSAHWN